MDKKEAKRLSIELMASAEAVYVTTIDEAGLPQTRVMFNLRNREQFPSLAELFQGHDDDLLIYLSTNTSSSKIDQMKTNPAVCAFYCKPKEFHSLMLSGRIEIIPEMEMKEAIWQDGWEMYYPKGPSDSDYTILRLMPVKAKGWYKDQPLQYNLGIEE